MRIAIGDIHGCLRTLRFLLEDKIGISKDDQIFFVGDYIEKGPDSKGVLDYLLMLKQEDYKINLTRGNKEEDLLKILNSEKDFSKWLKLGGELLLENLGINFSGYLEFKLDFPAKYIDLLENMKYFYDIGDYYIVHAGFNFSNKNPFTSYSEMLTIRDFSVDNSKLLGKKIVHGHNPKPINNLILQIKSNSSILSIDTGCVYNDKPEMGYLTGLNLDTLEFTSVKNREI